MEGKKNQGKKNLLLLFMTLPIISIVLCTVLFIRIGSLEKAIRDKDNVVEVTNEIKNTSSGDGQVVVINNEKDDEDSGVKPVDLGTSDDAQNDITYSEYDGIVKVYLTFDDGPSYNTNAILDILDDYGIKATFFINGHEGYEESLKRIVEEGHTIGMHSYSHSYRQVYKNLDSFADDLYEIQSYIYDVTGAECNIYRFPGGSSNHVSNVDMIDCIDYLKAKGIEYYDWNASARDAVIGGASVNTIVNNVIREVCAAESDTVIILLHDSGDKRTTVEALPIIIEKIADMNNVAFVPITEETTPIHHVESAH